MTDSKGVKSDGETCGIGAVTGGTSIWSDVGTVRNGTGICLYALTGCTSIWFDVGTGGAGTGICIGTETLGTRLPPLLALVEPKLVSALVLRQSELLSGLEFVLIKPELVSAPLLLKSALVTGLPFALAESGLVSVNVLPPMQTCIAGNA